MVVVRGLRLAGPLGKGAAAPCVHQEEIQEGNLPDSALSCVSPFTLPLHSWFYNSGKVATDIWGFVLGDALDCHSNNRTGGAYRSGAGDSQNTQGQIQALL